MTTPPDIRAIRERALRATSRGAEPAKLLIEETEKAKELLTILAPFAASEPKVMRVVALSRIAGFIAGGEHVPALCAEVERLRAENEALRLALETQVVKACDSDGELSAECLLCRVMVIGSHQVWHEDDCPLALSPQPVAQSQDKEGKL